MSNARPASDVYSWAKASTKPSYNTTEITNLGTLTTNSKSVTNFPNAATNSIINLANLVAGTYVLYGMIDYQISSGTGLRQLLFYNGSSAINDARIEVSAASSGWTRLTGSYIITLTSTSTIWLYGYQSSGSACTVVGYIKAVRIK